MNREIKFRWKRLRGGVAAFFCSVTLAACSADYIGGAGLGSVASARPIEERCQDVVVEIRKSVAEAGVSDGEARPIPGFPIFRTNRLLAALGKRLPPKARTSAFDAWVERLRQTDEVAVRLELANLGEDRFRRLSVEVFGRSVDREAMYEEWRTCSKLVSRTLLARANVRQQLVEAADVPDDYSELARTAGLFPVTSIAVSRGWERWKEQYLRTFERSPEHLPVTGRLIAFVPAVSRPGLSVAEVRDVISRSREPRLGIPEPKGSDLMRLFETFAPDWNVDVSGSYDRLGYPAWTANGEDATVDTSRPMVFTRVSHTVVGTHVLLQLNYAIWFQERPRESVVDPLGGRLDGVLWRVTIGEDGRPLVYDSIHACGCYHLLFPVRPFAAGAAARGRTLMRERPAILNVVPELKRGQRIVLWLASKSHYLQGVSTRETGARSGNGVHYGFEDDTQLRSLPISGGRRKSLYQSDGIVAGTERLERFALWPMGVINPGAMRQWGRHAIAFVDKRHFDDPKLLETIFGW